MLCAPSHSATASGALAAAINGRSCNSVASCVIRSNLCKCVRLLRSSTHRKRQGIPHEMLPSGQADTHPSSGGAQSCAGRRWLGRRGWVHGFGGRRLPRLTLPSTNHPLPSERWKVAAMALAVVGGRVGVVLGLALLTSIACRAQEIP